MKIIKIGNSHYLNVPINIIKQISKGQEYLCKLEDKRIIYTESISKKALLEAHLIDFSDVICKLLDCISISYDEKYEAYQSFIQLLNLDVENYEQMIKLGVEQLEHKND